MDYRDKLSDEDREFLARFDRDWERSHQHAQATDGVTRPPTNTWDAPAHKTCPKCKQHLPSDKFSKSSRRHDGLASHCKMCAYEVTLAWRRANRAKVQDYNKKFKNRSKDR